MADESSCVMAGPFFLHANHAHGFESEYAGPRQMASLPAFSSWVMQVVLFMIGVVVIISQPVTVAKRLHPITVASSMLKS